MDSSKADQRFPALDEKILFRLWPVDQIQIDRIEPQCLIARIESLERPIIALIIIPQFGGYERPLATLADRSTDFGFVAIKCGGVDRLIAHLDRIGDQPLGFLRRH